MESGIESIGEAVAGGLIARAVEPEAGEHQSGGEKCLNCRTNLLGDFCHTCGQKGHVHRTLSAFGHDLLHGVLHVEGKIWRTLPMLAWHPGQLTRRYVEGERASFVSPLAMFLFSVFLMFAVVNWIGGPFPDSPSQSPAEERAEAQKEFQQEEAEARAKLVDLRRQLQQAKGEGRSTTGLEQKIQGVELGLRVAKEAMDLEVRLANEEDAREAKQAQAEKAAETKVEREGDNSVAGDFQNAWGPARWFEKGFKKAKENPSLLFYKLQSNAYKFSWALIPISLPFVWVLFLHRRRYRRQYKAYDHVVFVTYSIAFMSLGFVLLTLLRPLGVGQVLAGFAITLFPPIHIYRQLRGAYSLSRFSAAWRTFLLLNFSILAASIFLILLLMFGLLG